jgi:hypothetical protein
VSLRDPKDRRVGRSREQQRESDPKDPDGNGGGWRGPNWATMAAGSHAWQVRRRGAQRRIALKVPRQARVRVMRALRQQRWTRTRAAG